MVVLQIPELVSAFDATHIVLYSFWPSFNVPFLEVRPLCVHMVARSPAFACTGVACGIAPSAILTDPDAIWPLTMPCVMRGVCVQQVYNATGYPDMIESMQREDPVKYEGQIRCAAAGLKIAAATCWYLPYVLGGDCTWRCCSKIWAGGSAKQRQLPGTEVTSTMCVRVPFWQRSCTTWPVVPWQCLMLQRGFCTACLACML